LFDQVEIRVMSGKGGDGAASFRHEKFVPYGGPDGGDGGDGGSVIIRADAGVTNLSGFRNKGFYRAEEGKRGQGKKKHGGNGSDLELAVPVGTVVWDKNSEGNPLADLESPGQKLVAAPGGRGGMGNARFRSSTNQAPRLIQKGEEARERELVLEMRLIADVGIVGYPNAGKSTLITALSAARPKIASYPFTTLSPVLGAVEVDGENVVFAEVPGLVDGAHLGRGLGHQFLRHVMRTRVLVILLDGTSGSPVEDIKRLEQELVLYDSALGGKPRVVAVNKVDLPEVKARVNGIKEEILARDIRPVFLSAATGEGLGELLAEVTKLLKSSLPEKEPSPAAEPEKIFHPEPVDSGRGTFLKENDTFIINIPGLERIVAGQGGSEAEVIAFYRRRMERSGLARAIAHAGAKPGDKVRIGNLEWGWP
jgi:GTP-binding protein